MTEQGRHREEDEQDAEHRTTGPDLSPRLMDALAAGTFLLLVYNVVYDSLSDDYPGYPVTGVLAGLLGGFIGIRRFMGGR